MIRYSMARVWKICVMYALLSALLMGVGELDLASASASGPAMASVGELHKTSVSTGGPVKISAVEPVQMSVKGLVQTSQERQTLTPIQALPIDPREVNPVDANPTLLINPIDELSGTMRANTDPVVDGLFRIGTINSVIIERGGERIIERFEGRMNRNRTTNIKSVSKSILSLLVGIAIEEGYLTGTDQTIGPFFPDYFAENPDPEKESITLQDLLTMRSGLASTSFHNYGRWVISSNWVEFVLNQPMEETPGGEMIYSTGTSHLLSALLTEATGMSTLAFANRYLFRPMGIRVGGWDRDPQGYYMGGNNMALSPEDLLKIGRLVMDGGIYNGEQLVPQAWIEESSVTYTRSVFNPYNYGYMWWKKPVGGHDALFAWGNGGQYIIMLRELDTVIVITSDLTRSPQSRRYQRDLFDYLDHQLMPFLEGL